MKKIILFLFISATALTAQTQNSKLLLSATSVPEIKNDISFSAPVVPEKTRKSSFLAAVYSLVLPGMGELYAGSFGTGKYFTMAEGVIWGAYIGFNTYGSWQKNNYKAFAQSRGGVTQAGKDEDFYANIGDFVSMEEYNRQMGLNGDFGSYYDAAQHNWNWKTDGNLREYRKIWVSSEQSYNNVRFAIGAMIVNRLISAFSAAKAARAYNRSLEPVETGWNVSAGYNPSPAAPSNLYLNFQTSF